MTCGYLTLSTRLKSHPHPNESCLQLTLTSVRVSWAGLLGRPDCADSIIVKHFKGDDTSHYDMSDPLDVSTNSFIVRDIVPLQPYTFQVSSVICQYQAVY